MIDRFYFRSIYYREPNGILYELATRGPGFATDEPQPPLGEALSLPPAFEPIREHVEPRLTPFRMCPVEADGMSGATTLAGLPLPPRAGCRRGARSGVDPPAPPRDRRR